jgi:type IV fimbrial biogenesis protein FimT
MLSDKCFANPAWRRASRGYNMIELITAMSIVAILLALAVPSFRYITNANRIASEGNGLLGDLQYARAEAIKEGRNVGVCISNNGTSCTGGLNWQNGWVIYSDLNNNGAFDAGEPVLRVQSPFSGSDTFVANNNLSALTFNREGFAAVLNNTLITLQTVPEVTSYTRCLSVGLAGLMEIQHYNGDTPGGTCQ